MFGPVLFTLVTVASSSVVTLNVTQPRAHRGRGTSNHTHMHEPTGARRKGYTYKSVAAAAAALQALQIQRLK